MSENLVVPTGRRVPMPGPTLGQMPDLMARPTQGPIPGQTPGPIPDLMVGPMSFFPKSVPTCPQIGLPKFGLGISLSRYRLT
jgi:hypothetical protein